MLIISSRCLPGLWYATPLVWCRSAGLCRLCPCLYTNSCTLRHLGKPANPCSFPTIERVQLPRYVALVVQATMKAGCLVTEIRLTLVTEIRLKLVTEIRLTLVSRTWHIGPGCLATEICLMLVSRTWHSGPRCLATEICLTLVSRNWHLGQVALCLQPQSPDQRGLKKSSESELIMKKQERFKKNLK